MVNPMVINGNCNGQSFDFHHERAPHLVPSFLRAFFSLFIQMRPGMLPSGSVLR